MVDGELLLSAMVRDVGAVWRILRVGENAELVLALAQGTVKPSAARVLAKMLAPALVEAQACS